MMKKVLLFGLILTSIIGVSYAQTTPPDMVVNRIFRFSSVTSGPNAGQYDAVELLVIKDKLDIRNWIIQEFGSGITSQETGGMYRFANNDLWKSLRSGTVITLREAVSNSTPMIPGGALYVQDVNPSDFIIDISFKNDIYMTPLLNTANETKNFIFTTNSEAVLIRKDDGSGSAIGYTNPVHLFAYGSDLSSKTILTMNLSSCPKIYAAAAGPAVNGFVYARANSSGAGFTHSGWNVGTGTGSAGKVSPVADPLTYNYQWGDGFNHNAVGLTDNSNFNATFIASLRNAVLPVSLLSFTANASLEGNILSWSTASETNHSHFEIYRSNGNDDFSFLNKVSKEVSGLDVKTYQFIDENFLSGSNYYKLRQVDKDGNFEDFEVRYVNNGAKSDEIISYTTEDKIFVKFNLSKSQSTIVSLRDLTGKTLVTQKSYLNSGANIIELPKAGVSGVYLISVQKENGELTTNKILL